MSGRERLYWTLGTIVRLSQCPWCKWTSAPPAPCTRREVDSQTVFQAPPLDGSQSNHGTTAPTAPRQSAHTLCQPDCLRVSSAMSQAPPRLRREVACGDGGPPVMLPPTIPGSGGRVPPGKLLHGQRVRRVECQARRLINAELAWRTRGAGTSEGAWSVECGARGRRVCVAHRPVFNRKTSNKLIFKDKHPNVQMSFGSGWEADLGHSEPLGVDELERVAGLQLENRKARPVGALSDATPFRRADGDAPSFHAAPVES